MILYLRFLIVVVFAFLPDVVRKVAYDKR
jgi:hypothetical protein